ncbi:MAG: hypothetical protein ABGY42_09825, partial [bacterium]
MLFAFSILPPLFLLTVLAVVAARNDEAALNYVEQERTRQAAANARLELNRAIRIRRLARAMRPKRQRRRQERAKYEELDKYPVAPPHAFARIVRDLRTLNIMYQAIEPPLTKAEQRDFELIMDIFVKSVTADIEEIDTDPAGYLRAAMDQVIKSYSMRITKKSRSKIFYYLKRDLLGYGRMDVLMNDSNVED